MQLLTSCRPPLNRLTFSIGKRKDGETTEGSLAKLRKTKRELGGDGGEESSYNASNLFLKCMCVCVFQIHVL